MKNTKLIAGLLLASTSPASLFAMEMNAHNHNHHHASVSQYAPIGVMGDSLHDQGKWMLSYRFMKMDMSGNRIGDKRVSARDVIGTMQAPGKFVVAPENMKMDMHMLGVMYGLTDKVTLTAMTSFASNEMDHLTRNGATFTTESSGQGDTSIGALVSLYQQGKHTVLANLNISLPTGSTTERDDTPVMKNVFLPYPMQLGSGTYDFKPAITYRGLQSETAISWGAQVSAVIRQSDNNEGYALGNRLAVTAWLSKELNSKLSLSFRVNYQDWDAIDGANTALKPMMIQTAKPALQAGKRTDALLGLNYLYNSDYRFGIEYSEAVSQDLVGPQLETDSVLTLGIQKSF